MLRSRRAVPWSATVPLLSLCLLIACAQAQGGAGAGVAAAASTGALRRGAWIDLLEHPAQQWRGYKQATLPDGWAYDTESRILTRLRSGGDVITRDQYGDFELELEWRVGAKGNSGIFYRATEATDVIYMNATEMQVLDNAGHRDGGSPLTSAGANYGLYAPPKDVTKPVGEWNRARVVAVGDHVEHWLNGEKVVDYSMGSEEWTAKVKGSKFVQWPLYGLARRGHIGLQDHGDIVSFRGIRIREITR